MSNDSVIVKHFIKLFNIYLVNLYLTFEVPNDFIW